VSDIQDVEARLVALEAKIEWLQKCLTEISGVLRGMAYMANQAGNVAETKE